MINAATPVANTQSATLTTPAQKAAAVKPQSASDIQDTVHLTGAAQAQVSNIKAAAQEAEETPSQTGQEARAGDHQAQRLLAKEAQTAKLHSGK